MLLLQKDGPILPDDDDGQRPWITQVLTFLLISHRLLPGNLHDELGHICLNTKKSKSLIINYFNGFSIKPLFNNT